MGLSRSGGGAVSKHEWDKFVADNFVSGFPNGFTIVETTGYWRDETTKATIYENGKQVVILLRFRGGALRFDAFEFQRGIGASLHCIAAAGGVQRCLLLHTCCPDLKPLCLGGQGAFVEARLRVVPALTFQPGGLLS